MRRILIALAVLLLVGGWAFERQGRGDAERTLTAATAELAGRQVRVQCQSLWSDLFSIGNGSLGEVRVDESGRPVDHTRLTRDTCRHLREFLDSHGHPELDCLPQVDWSAFRWETGARDACVRQALPVAQGLVTLTHEAMHLRGWMGEAQAQCYAVQSVAWTLARLGGSRADGEAVARLALAYAPSMPNGYSSAECRAEGALDLHPETAAFPTEAEPVPPPGYGPALA